MNYRPNRRDKATKRPAAITKREAEDLARQIRNDFPGVRVISKSSGYAVEVEDKDGYPVTITSFDDLRMIPNRKSERAKRPAAITKREAEDLARQIRNDFPGVRVISKSSGYAVEVEDKDGYPVTITSFDDLRMIPNRLPKPPVRKSTKRKSWQDLIHEAERDKYPFDHAIRNGSKSEFGFVHDAGTNDFLRPATREDMLQSLKSPSGRYLLGGRSVYVRNGSDTCDLICVGLCEGFLASAIGETGHCPEEVREFSAAFYAATKRLNRFSLEDFFFQHRDTSDPELFGYYIAMQASGEGVSWWDDDRPMRSGSDKKKLVLPHVEASGEDGEVLYLGMDADRLKFTAWGK